MTQQSFYKYFLIFILLFISSLVHAQNFERYKAGSVFMGSSLYSGDLSPDMDNPLSFYFPAASYSLGMNYDQKVHPRIMVGGFVNWSRLFADDNQIGKLDDPVLGWNYYRNLHFRNDVFEVGVHSNFYLFKSYGFASERKIVNPYIKLGLGALYHNPVAKVPMQYGSNLWVDLKDLGTEGQGYTGVNQYSNWAISVPFGIGIDVAISQRLDLSLEAAYHFTSTDYLDDVSGVYPDLTKVGDNNEFTKVMSDRSQESVAAITGVNRTISSEYEIIPGTARGNKLPTDAFLTVGFKLRYILSKGGDADRFFNIQEIMDRHTRDHDHNMRDTSRIHDPRFNAFIDRYQIENLAINTAYSEKMPSFYLGGILFVSDNPKARKYLPNNRVDKFNIFYTPIHDIQLNELTKPVLIKNELFLKEYHFFSAIEVPNSNKVILTLFKDNNNSKKEYHNKLYLAEVSGENTWKNLEELPFNELDFSVAQPTISADGNTLVFVSNDPNGKGGSDLYQSYKYKGHWTIPHNMGDMINTPGNEVAPFLHPDGVLYFSSDFHDGLGALDVFEARFDENNEDVLNVANVGAPINSPYDDFGLILDDVKRTGFFTSNRPGGMGDNDLYKVNVLKINKSRLLTDQQKDFYHQTKMVLKGQVLDANMGTPVKGAIVKLNCVTDDDLNLQITGSTGLFQFEMKNDAEYQLGATIRGYDAMEMKAFSTLGHSVEGEVIQLNLEAKPLAKEMLLKGTVLNNITNVPVGGATINLKNLINGNVVKTVADEKGAYQVKLEGNFKYTITVDYKGYQQMERVFTTSTKRSSSTTVYHIKLKPALK